MMVEMKPGKGYTLMIVGALIYFTVFIISLTYTPSYRNIEDTINYSRTMAVLGFFGVFIFMYGSIIETKSLWISLATLRAGGKTSPEAQSEKGDGSIPGRGAATSEKEDKPNMENIKERNYIGWIIRIVIVLILIILFAMIVAA